MSKFTGKNQVRAAFKRSFTDRVPFYPNIGLGGLSWHGVSAVDSREQACSQGQMSQAQNPQ